MNDFMNKIKEDFERGFRESTYEIGISKKKDIEIQIEHLLQEKPRNMNKIYASIKTLAYHISRIEKYEAEGIILRSKPNIENELLKKYHIPPIRDVGFSEEDDRKKIEIYEKKLEEVSQKTPLNLSRIYHLINLIGHFKGINENEFQEIKRELCEKYNIPIIRREQKLPYHQLHSHPPRQSRSSDDPYGDATMVISFFGLF